MKKNTSNSKWAVCYNSDGNPSTWGKIKEMDEIRTIVIYGDDAPIWDINLWWNKNVKVFDTEREARNVVDVYRTADSYYYCRHDPR